MLRKTNAHPLSLSGPWAAQFTELAEDFPAESAVVVEALKLMYDHEEQARDQGLSAQERLVYHQTYSEPVLTTLKTWLEQQTAERW